MEPDQTKNGQIEESKWLPDFCRGLFLLPLFIVTEGFAITITLVSIQSFAQFWNSLAITSLYMLWIALIFSLLLCFLRPTLRNLSPGRAFLFIYLLLLATITTITELLLWLGGETIPPHLLPLTDMLLLKSLIIGAIVGGFGLRYLYIQQQWRMQVEAEAGYRLQALQTRIRPHFLFNTINSITSLIHSSPDHAESALLNLADLFRQSLNNHDHADHDDHGEQKRTLEAEIDLTKRYLEIEKLRLNERLDIDWQIDLATLDLPVPPFILQPLVENAIYHGIEQIPEGGTIMIKSHYGHHHFTISVTNPIPRGDAYRVIRSSGQHMALENIGHRIQALDPNGDGINILRSDQHFIVTLTLPISQGRADPQ